ncbi:MAG: glucose PTS transporter subunit IIA [Mycoplasmoidaceae bacterium]
MQLNNFKEKITSHLKNRKGSGNAREFIGKLSRGLMLPISLLPIAGLFLGIGAAIVNGSNGNEAMKLFGQFLQLPGDAIFGALPVLFAIAIAITFTRDAGTAGLSAIVAFLAFGGIQQALIVPVMNANDGNIIGYNLLFYAPNMWGLTSSADYGLDASLFSTVLGWRQLSTSAFGGFIVGFTVAYLYNKFKDIQLPAVIGFFSGVRFIPIVTFIAFLPITILVLMIWPLVGTLFGLIGGALGSGMFGFQSFIFGYIERSLVPFGLHHAFYTPLWLTSIGGTLNLNDLAIVNGNFVSIVANSTEKATWLDIVQASNELWTNSTVSGDQGVWAFVNSNLAGKTVYELGTSNTTIIEFSDVTTTVYQANLTKLSEGSMVALSQGVNIGQYTQGKYPFMMFGLPAAGAAMVMAAPKENRKMAGSVVLSASLTAFLTGITEPIEFTFLFLAPWLFWGFHAFFCALSFGLMTWWGMMFPEVAPHIGITFSGGIIDWVIYGAIQIPAGSNAWVSLLIGIPYVPIYFFFFLWAIKKFNIATPGRGENTKLYTKADFNARKDGKNSAGSYDPEVLGIIQAYGGFENIQTVDACITKLRISVKDDKNVDEKRLTNDLGALGVIKPSKKAVYAIYGTRADWIKNQINTIISDVEKNPKLKEEIFKGNATKKATTQDSSKKDSNSKIKNEVVNVYAPFDGEIVPMNKVPDKTFSDNLMGKGLAIKPSSKEVKSVLEKGKLELVFDTGHAYIFKTEDGTSILVHVGIDSINLKDSAKKDISVFSVKSKAGQSLKKDSPISEINLKDLEKYAKSSVTPIIALNETLEGRKIEIKAKGPKVKKGDLLFVIKP